MLAMRWPFSSKAPSRQSSLLANRFRRNALALGRGTALGQGIVFACTPILTRMYAPGEMALLGLFLAFIGPAVVMLSLRYDLAIVVARNDDDARRLLLASLLLLPITGILAGLLLHTLIAMDWGGYAALPAWAAPVTTLLLIATGVFTCLRYWCVRCGYFDVISIGLINQGVGRAIASILAGLFTNTWVGLLTGEAAGRMLGIRKLAVRALPSVVDGMKGLTKSSLLECLIRHKDFPRVILPSAILDAVSGTIFLPVFSSVYGTGVAGRIFLAHRVVEAPALLVSAAVGDVYLHRILEAAKTNPASCTAELLRAASQLFLVGCALYLPFALLAPFVSQVVFGSQWADVGILIAALTPAAMSTIVTNTLGRAIAMSTVPTVKFVADAVRLFLPTGVIVLCGMRHLSVVDAAIWFALATAVGDVSYFLALVYAVAPTRLRPFASAAS